MAPKKKDRRVEKDNKKSSSKPDYEKRRKSVVSRAVKRQSKTVRQIAEVIKRSLTKSDQSSGSFTSEKNYAIALPSGVIKDVRGR